MGNQISKVATAASSIHALTDDLLELVLLRARSHVCLVRAAATCRLWRRVIADAGFLRRVRHLHAPHVLGYITKRLQGNQTDFVPAGVTPPGTISLSSLDFLHQSMDHNLRLIDSRGGLLAFADDVDGFVICDPCRRHHRKVDFPPLLEDNKLDWQSYVTAFLLDTDADYTDIGPLLSRFRVLYVGVDVDGRRAKVYAFTARDGRWSLLSSTAAGDIVWAVRGLYYSHLAHLYLLGRTGGSIFWGIPRDHDVLTLDERTGEFSVLVLPEPAGSNQADGMQYRRSNLRAISGNARTVRLVRIVDDDLEVLTVVRDSGACVVDGRVGLSHLAKIEQTRSLAWNFMDTAPAAGPGYVVLSPDHKNLWMLSIETMVLERLSEWSWHLQVFPYELPWPPTIKVCL